MPSRSVGMTEHMRGTPTRRELRAAEARRTSRRKKPPSAVRRGDSSPSGRRSGPRRHPASVLMAMSVVGGLFTVAALPAYAVVAPSAIPAAEPTGSQSLVVSSELIVGAQPRDNFGATSGAQLALSLIHI